MRIDTKLWRLYSVMSGVVMAKALMLYGAYKLGTYLDAKFGTYPLCFFVLITATTALGFYWIMKVVEKNRV